MTDQWGAAAEHWARAAEKEEVGAAADAAKWMLRAAGLRPGERVLEVAGGAGRVGLQAAAEVGPEGSVLCSDFSPEMVKVARERFERLGVSNIETRVLDAQDLDLDDGSFDVVLCRYGYMLMPDPLQALRESARVLRPGGRLVLAVWGEAEKNPWLSNILGAVMAYLNAPPPEPGVPGPFALGDTARLRDLLDQAGLAEAEVEDFDAEQPYDSLDAWWEKILSVGGPLKAVLDSLPEADLNAIRKAALASGELFADGGSAIFPAVVVGARARKPG
ncbi:MAG TPA: methyltransferase domain-containing protein [Solirubrobacterales bacterium]|nr:methyltransferase domain-containing protein [Solirubrobacterales bacterium]